LSKYLTIEEYVQNSTISSLEIIPLMKSYFNLMIEKFGDINTWSEKYGCYFHGESLLQYPEINIDNKSTYPTIINLTRNPN
jgi:hypothetical protein